MHLTTDIKLECALFVVRTVIVRDQLEQEFFFRFESTMSIKVHLNKKYFDNRLKLVPSSENVLNNALV